MREEEIKLDPNNPDLYAILFKEYRNKHKLKKILLKPVISNIKERFLRAGMNFGSVKEKVSNSYIPFKEIQNELKKIGLRIYAFNENKFLESLKDRICGDDHFLIARECNGKWELLDDLLLRISWSVDTSRGGYFYYIEFLNFQRLIKNSLTRYKSIY